MKKKFYVYIYKDPRQSDRPIYVGKGTGNRYRQHLSDKEYYCVNKRFTGRIAKIREDEFEPIIDIIEEFDDEEEAFELERKLISEYGRVGYEENGLLMNHLIDGRPPTYPKGEHPWQGRKHTQKSKDKIGKSKSGRKAHNKGLDMKEEQKEKLRQKALSKERIEQAKINLKNAHRANTGAKRSQETKDKIAKGNSILWEVTMPDGTTIEVLNLTKFCREHNVDQGNLSRYGKAKGYTAVKI